ncbi:MAG: gfo/Idh/MocA family oxidoreductase, partial [Candidatus Rokuibacteriota bacterium]
RRIDSGLFGPVIHVEVSICLDILGPGGGFADANVRHPALSLAGGAIADFLPHLASLAHAFVGAHRSAHTVWSKRTDTVLPYDEFRALVDAERGTASLGFSASSQPDAFWLRVYGERMAATTNLFETRLTFDRVRGGPKPLRPLLNGLEEGKAIRRAAVGSLMRKFKLGPGAYDGMWDLLGRSYRALQDGSTPPVTLPDVLAVNRLVDALKPAPVAA